MKLISYYIKFFEGRNKIENPRTPLSIRGTLGEVLPTITEFKDLIALFPNVQYKVEVSGRITFFKSFANKRCSIVINKENNNYKILMDEQNHVVDEDYPSLAEALKGMWSYQIARQAKLPFKAESIRKVLLDTDEFLGKELSYQEILDIVCKVEPNINEAFEYIKQAFNFIGLEVLPHISSKTDTRTDNIIIDGLLISKNLKPVYTKIYPHFTSECYYSQLKSDILITVSEKVRKDSYHYTSIKLSINPVNQQNAIYLILNKINNAFSYTTEITLDGEVKDRANIPNLIAAYSNELSKYKGTDTSIFLKCYYNAITKIKGKSEILYNIKIYNDKLWDELCSVGKESFMNATADLYE